MSLSGALSNAISGLGAAQIGIEWAAQNISNANTTGYTRKVIQQQSNEIGGVRITAIERSVNQTLFRQSLSEVADLSARRVESDYLERLVFLLGDPTSGGRMSTELARFSEAVENLALAPSDLNARVLLADRAGSVAGTFQDLTDSVQDMRATIDQEIRDTLAEVNTALEEIAYLNGQIGHYSSVNQPVGDLEDARDQALKTVSSHMPVRIVERDNGELTVYLPSGMTLVDGQARPFDSYGNLLNIGPTTEYPNQFEPITFASSPGSDVTAHIEGGRLGKLIGLRDVTLPQVQNQLDNLAMNLRDELNRVHNRGTALPPPESLTAAHAFHATDVQFTVAGTHDTAIVVLDAAGQQVEAASLQDFVAASPATWPTFTLDDLDGVSVGNISMSVTAGRLDITFDGVALPQGAGLALIDTGLGAGESDAAITVARAGGGGPTREVSGFSNLFGFNDLLTGETGGPKMRSNGYGLNEAISAAPYDIEVLTAQGPVTVSLAANTTLEDARTALIGAGLDASIVRSGEKYALRIGPPDPLAVSVSSGGSIDLAFHASEVGAAEAFALADTLATDPRGIAAGRLVLSGSTYSVGSNDVAIANAMAAAFQGTATYPASAAAPEVTTSFQGYNAQIVGTIASLADSAGRDLEVQELFMGQLESRLSQAGGVSIDAELSNMIKLQNAYSAAAKVVSTVNKMFEILDNVLR